MRQARALPLPNEALYIEEIKFWLNIMQEHTKFIKAGLPIESVDFTDATKEFERAFTSLLQKAERLKSVKQSKDFIGDISEVMRAFEHFQRKILSDIFQGKLHGTNYPFFLDHMLREAKCFGGFLERMQEEKGITKTVSHTREIVVWLRFMADHAKLLKHYIDPSECRVSRMVEDFIKLFDSLVLEARDLASMLYCHKGEVKVFRRFLLDIRLDVQRLRDFNKMAEDLIRDCRLLGIMNVELASHMRREAEHCLLKIALLEKEFLKHCPDDFQDDADDAVWESSERNDEEDDDIAQYDGEESEEREEEVPPDTRMEQTIELIEADNEAGPVVTILAQDPTENVALPVENELPIEDIHENLRREHKADIVDKAVKGDEEKSVEPVFIKPGEQKAMPKSCGLPSPRERYAKTRQMLPRPLGKTKK